MYRKIMIKNSLTIFLNLFIMEIMKILRSCQRLQKIWYQKKVVIHLIEWGVNKNYVQIKRFHIINKDKMI